MLISNRKISVDDLIYSETAAAQGISNIIHDDEINYNIERLIDNIITPVWENFGGTLHVTSGYRCIELNRYIGSKDTSQHVTGHAVDFGIIDTDIFDICLWIKKNLSYDHLILEKYNVHDLNKGWVHCSYVSREENRKYEQTYDGKQYHEGLVKLPLAV